MVRPLDLANHKFQPHSPVNFLGYKRQFGQTHVLVNASVLFRSACLKSDSATAQAGYGVFSLAFTVSAGVNKKNVPVKFSRYIPWSMLINFHST